MKRLFLLGAYFFLTPVFIFLLIFYQIFLYHQNSQVHSKSLGQNRHIEYSAVPDKVQKATHALSAREARIEVLREFFARYNSPLEDFADHIVATADKYDLDYRLLPAIAMQESTLCKKTPADSYNCWGFGIYGNKVTRFVNFEEAIETVSKTLALNYHAQGLRNPIEIMSKYTPSNTGEWAENVSYVMSRISSSL